MLIKLIITFYFVLCGGSLFLSFPADLDPATIEKLQIEHTYEFGFPVRDTVRATIHIYREKYNNWYVKGLNSIDYYSDTQPIILEKGLLCKK